MHKSRFKISHLLSFFLCSFIVFSISAQAQDADIFIEKVSLNKSDFYHVDLKTNKNISTELPIGMFDSGTGGLTVIDALLNFDEFVSGTDSYLKEGDEITIDLEARSINVKLSDEEIKLRKSEWKAPEAKVKSGYLARYAKMVGSASNGAVLEN